MKEKETGTIITPFQKTGLYIQDVTGKGRGLFCSHKISQQEDIEITPALFFNGQEASHIDETVLYNYYFSLEKLSDKEHKRLGLSEEKSAGAIPLGLMSLCNHSEKPNARITKTIDGKTLLFTLTATEDILPDTEIMISYGMIWFETV